MTEKPSQNFGEKLKTLREAKEISIQQMHVITGFARSTIRKWEQNKSYPSSYKIILLLADFFKVPPSYFEEDQIKFPEDRTVQNILNRLQRLEKVVFKDEEGTI